MRPWKQLLPWIGGTILVSGIACSAVAAMLFFWASRDLPDLSRLEDHQPPQTTTILARDGSVLGTLAHENRHVIGLDAMPKYLPQAFLAAEDDKFYTHGGVDPTAIARAAFVNFTSGARKQGGSTITQQVIKQLLLSSERSYTRKMKEAILAYQLERTLSKDQILLTYLNYIYLGQHAYGVEAAARTYFGKHASDITLAEAALIAGLPQAPSRYNPFRHPEEAKNRQLYVLRRMRELRWISDEEHRKASEEPLVYWSMPEHRPGAAEWYLEEARRLLVEFFTPENLRALGVETRKSGEDYVYEAGLTVRTAMDPVQQDAAGAALRQGLEELDRRQGWRGSLRNLDAAGRAEFLEKHKGFAPESLAGGAPTDALVTGMEGGRLMLALGGGWTGFVSRDNLEWTRGRIPRAGDVVRVYAGLQPPPPDGGKEGRQRIPYDPEKVARERPISMALHQEPLVQGALASIEPQTGDVVALIGGYQFGNSHFNRATQARRQPGSSFKPIVYSAALDAGFTPLSPLLDAPFVYVDPVTRSVWRPSNYEGGHKGVMPLHRALALSRNTTTVRVAQAVGVDNIIRRAKSLGLEGEFPRALPISLGAAEVTPLNLTQAYAAFANRGLGVRPRIITSIVDARGRELLRQDVEHWQAISPQNAFQMACLLKEVVNAGTGGRARVNGHSNIGGKTGTTNDSCDAWFVGFSPYLATGVFVGFDQVRTLGRQEQGGRTAAPIFRYYRSAIEDLYKDHPQEFAMPPGITMQGGIAFNGPVRAGAAALDGLDPDALNDAEGADEKEEGEDVMRELF